MIVTVVKNDQLKSPRANAANKDILLVLPTGKVLRPLKLTAVNSFCKEYLVAFDIPVEQLVQKRINFSGWENQQDILIGRICTRTFKLVVFYHRHYHAYGRSSPRTMLTSDSFLPVYHL